LSWLAPAKLVVTELSNYPAEGLNDDEEFDELGSEDEDFSENEDI